jgi:hypothetical protein
MQEQVVGIEQTNLHSEADYNLFAINYGLMRIAYCSYKTCKNKTFHPFAKPGTQCPDCERPLSWAGRNKNYGKPARDPKKEPFELEETVVFKDKRHEYFKVKKREKGIYTIYNKDKEIEAKENELLKIDVQLFLPPFGKCTPK